MPYFQPRLSKGLAVAAMALGLFAQVQAAEPTAPEEQELYEYLFPEAGKSRAQVQPVETGGTQSAPAMQSAWGKERPQAWSADQKQAMLDAFKAKPATEQPPKLLTAPEVSGSAAYAPVKLDGQPYADLIDIYSKKQNLSPLLVQQIIQAESKFDPNIVSKKGASGLMQLMPATAAELNVDPFDPEENIKGGTQYFAMLLEKYGRVDYALAAYNAGPGAVDKYNGIPPFPETENYVSKIMAGVAQLEAKN